MKRPRLRWRSRCWVPLGVLLLPPLAWTFLLAVLPTGWARARVVARLEAVSGRSVSLGALRVGVFGGLTLSDVAVAAPAHPSDPWLQVVHARVDASLAQLLFGRIDPSDVVLDGLTLRVHRRVDGTYELADALPLPAQTDKNSAADAAEPPALRFRLTKARLTLLDEPTGTRLEITDLEGCGVWEGKKTAIERLCGMLNGGRVELAAQLDRSATRPAFEARVRTEQVGLDPGLRLLDYVAPVLAGESSGLQGNLDLNVYVRGVGTTREDLRRTLIGQGTVALDPVRLAGSPLVAALAAALSLPETEEVGAMRSSFAIKGGRVTTDELTVDFARWPLVFSGWTDFDGLLNYRLKAERLVAGRLSGSARELVSESGVDPNGEGVLAITGDLERIELTLDGKPLGEEVGTREGRERKLRDLARKRADDCYGDLPRVLPGRAA